jgi:hypothetical protein
MFLSADVVVMSMLRNILSNQINIIHGILSKKNARRTVWERGHQGQRERTKRF